ncbi:MAG: hypothetical protein EOP83_01910 [Verrucomicrobiaceae bacterium]|nr:MAG: hypothetical protein EOP83_01910 [Verrucomicrobiaceae bacterium]
MADARFRKADDWEVSMFARHGEVDTNQLTHAFAEVHERGEAGTWIPVWNFLCDLCGTRSARKFQADDLYIPVWIHDYFGGRHEEWRVVVFFREEHHAFAFKMRWG